MEELHRLHLANTLHDIGSPLQAFVNGLDQLTTYVRSTWTQDNENPQLIEGIEAMQAAVTMMTLARRRAIAYAKQFTRAEALRPSLVCVDLRQLVQDCLALMRGNACAAFRSLSLIRCCCSCVPAYCKNRERNVLLSATVADDVPDCVYIDGEHRNLIHFILNNILTPQ